VYVVVEASGEIRVSIHCYSFGSKVILGLRDFLERRKMRPGMRNTIRLGYSHEANQYKLPGNP